MNALIQEANAQIGHAAMRRLLDTAPHLARCSDNKTASHIRPRDYAIRWSYMQINRPDMVSWLIFDLDHANPNIWDDKDFLHQISLSETNKRTRRTCTMRSFLFAQATKQEANLSSS